MTARDALEFFGLLAMGACTVMFAALWWTSFLTNDAIRMTISSYGERYPEVALWFLITPLMLYGLGSYLSRTARS